MILTNQISDFIYDVILFKSLPFIIKKWFLVKEEKVEKVEKSELNQKSLHNLDPIKQACNSLLGVFIDF